MYLAAIAVAEAAFTESEERCYLQKSIFCTNLLSYAMELPPCLSRIVWLSERAVRILFTRHHADAAIRERWFLVFWEERDRREGLGWVGLLQLNVNRAQ